jgi:hypothetical protein
MNVLSNLFFGVTNLAKNLYESDSDFDSEFDDEDDVEGESLSTSSIYSSTDDKDATDNVNSNSCKSTSSIPSLTGIETNSNNKNSNVDINKGFPGISLKYCSNGEKNSWKECDASAFNCRIGPNYNWYIIYLSIYLSIYLCI